MGVVTFIEEFASPVAAGKLFKALVLDNNKLIPQLIPQAVKSVETIEGDGSPGSIKKMTLVQGTNCYKINIYIHTPIFLINLVNSSLITYGFFELPRNDLAT